MQGTKGNKGYRSYVNERFLLNILFYLVNTGNFLYRDRCSGFDCIPCRYGLEFKRYIWNVLREQLALLIFFTGRDQSRLLVGLVTESRDLVAPQTELVQRFTDLKMAAALVVKF